MRENQNNLLLDVDFKFYQLDLWESLGRLSEQHSPLLGISTVRESQQS